MELYTVLIAEVLPVLTERLDETPKPEDVKAGWVGFGVFLGLCVMVALLGWAMSRQLKRTAKNREAGAFGPYRGPVQDNRIPSNDDADAPVQRVDASNDADDAQRPQA
ncbi:hypothetical protein [Nocardioides sp. zg-DK7169]|uniref:hypothetical protein n=1 Tax=Nocardioides sp. zg-DK7169 TaxID=2736600 RepID=UPI001551F726|nr:hypothetical protein [Nocardioides sp. zg-DK7169]NPC95763.1 hypothetical protein [Nocardioides sp. zg-DK7169]